MNEADMELDQPLAEQILPSISYPSECDLVMKGGITSGVVYPLAIVEIAKAFRLRSIGGTSAGAIAAAAAAAAEAGKQRRKQGLLDAKSQCSDFELLAQLPHYLASPDKVTTRTGLLGMFRAHPRLSTLFDGLTTSLSIERKRTRYWSVAKCLSGELRIALLFGFVLGALPLTFTEWQALHFFTLVWFLVGGLLCAAIGGFILLAARLVSVLRSNRFGLCSGMPEPGDTTEVASQCLTVWLHRYLDQLSGQADVLSEVVGAPTHKPLTFGDLAKLDINLQMMTTCLSQGRPYRLPFRDDVLVRENNQFYYLEEDFRELFPAKVVDWMIAHQRPAQGGSHSEASRIGYCRLPKPEDLPVVVAVRMSLSFPFLLSAIPLYATDYGNPGKDLECCWFSDGGLSSNFPIHFFDSPLPQRPTFGLDLGVLHDYQDPKQDRVFFPQNNNQARLPSWRRFHQLGALGSIGGFVSAIFNTATEWSHDTLSRLPGFRDRVALIRLTAEEGGLNLAMPESRINALTRYGQEAGIEFVRRFGDCSHLEGIAPSPDMNWENHQLIRLRLLIASVSEVVGCLRTTDIALNATPSQRYQRFFTNAKLGPATYRFQQRAGTQQSGPPFRSQAVLAQHILESLLKLAAEIAASTAQPGGATIDPENKAPKPTPEFKLKPRI
jgi:predicted acylesterase/phospholipase RssA